MFYPIILLFLPPCEVTLVQDVKQTAGPECETVAGDKCVFPFTFQGRTYYACTTHSSDNGSPWCAVQVSQSVMFV